MASNSPNAPTSESVSASRLPEPRATLALTDGDDELEILPPLPQPEPEPEPGKLPQKKRMDRLLNKTTGSLWIDAETFQIARSSSSSPNASGSGGGCSDRSLR